MRRSRRSGVNWPPAAVSPARFRDEQHKMNTAEKQTVDFGFSSVDARDKAKLVAQVFHSVAGRYDLMNDLMSLGIHRWPARMPL